MLFFAIKKGAPKTKRKSNRKKYQKLQTVFFFGCLMRWMVIEITLGHKISADELWWTSQAKINLSLATGYKYRPRDADNDEIVIVSARAPHKFLYFFFLCIQSSIDGAIASKFTYKKNIKKQLICFHRKKNQRILKVIFFCF